MEAEKFRFSSEAPQREVKVFAFCALSMTLLELSCTVSPNGVKGWFPQQVFMGGTLGRLLDLEDSDPWVNAQMDW